MNTLIDGCMYCINISVGIYVRWCVYAQSVGRCVYEHLGRCRYMHEHRVRYTSKRM